MSEKNSTPEKVLVQKGYRGPPQQVNEGQKGPAEKAPIVTGGTSVKPPPSSNSDKK